MEFRTPKIEDAKIIREYFKDNDFYGCEYSVANSILWAEYYKLTFCIIKGYMVFRINKDAISYSYPVGSGNVKEVFDILIDDCKQKNIPFIVHGITKKMAEQLNEMYDNKFTFKFDDGASDYVYNSSDLINLVGKKYSAKRNHLNKIQHLNWQFEHICCENTNDCIEMSKKWCRQNDCLSDEQKYSEMKVVINSLKHYDELGLKGGLIRLDGEVIAFSIGEEINKNIFVVHIEKAFSNIAGAYPLINREFCKNVASAYPYINREEDLGVEGLRKAKRSYYPVFLVEKAYGVYNV